MKTILIQDNHKTGVTTLANPYSKPGRQSDHITVKAIVNVPNDFPETKLLLLWSQTCDVTWLNKEGDYMSRGRFTFDFDELGVGKILF